MSEPQPAASTLSGRRDRLLVTYVVRGAADMVADLAHTICLEQTVEVVDELARDPWIRGEIVGRLESIEELGEGRHELVISYSEVILGRSVPQLLNVIYGNVSLLPGVKIVDVQLPETIGDWLPGPALGIEGIRGKLGVHDRPMVAAALKPMGRSPRELAGYAWELARGGIDLIKDDHGLADHTFCPFEERVQRCLEAVREGEELSGGRSLYLPNLVEGPARLAERLDWLEGLGVDGVLLAPALVGWDWLREIAARPTSDMVLVAHPAMLGAFISDPDSGVSRSVLLGRLLRALGADVVIFPSHGGRFAWSREATGGIVDALRSPQPGLRPALPMPAGGLSVETVGRVAEGYGRDTVFLIGSNLYVRSSDLASSVEEFMGAVAGV